MRAYKERDAIYERMERERSESLAPSARQVFDLLRKEAIDSIPEAEEVADIMEGIEHSASNPRAFLDAVCHEITALGDEAGSSLDDFKKQYEQTGLTREMAEELAMQGIPLILSIV